MARATTRANPATGREKSLAAPLVRRHPLITESARRLTGECNVPAGSHVIVAVSGGADSCALLLACAALAQRKGGPVGRVTACHVHHHLRDEADDEAAFVEALCAQLGVPVRVEHVHPAGERGSKAANARRLRYAALERTAREVGAAFVLTAHHAEDQLETLLMALGRGAGLRGLRGMAWRRALGKVALIRPMLLVRKRECEALCAKAGVKWCSDPTNVDMSSKRARLRRDVLPVLEELWPGAARRSTGSAELLQFAQQLIEERVTAAFELPGASWKRDEVAALPAAIIAEGLRRAAEHLHGQPMKQLGQRQLRAAVSAVRSDEKSPKRFEWPNGIVVRVTSKTVSIGHATDSPSL